MIFDYHLNIEIDKLKFELEGSLERNYQNMFNDNKFNLINEYIIYFF